MLIYTIESRVNSKLKRGSTSVLISQRNTERQDKLKNSRKPTKTCWLSKRRGVKKNKKESNSQNREIKTVKRLMQNITKTLS